MVFSGSTTEGEAQSDALEAEPSPSADQPAAGGQADLWCERELKLEGDEAAIAAAFVSLLPAPDAAPARVLSSTYFDTPACSLLSHGHVLRIRQGEGKSVQTLKWRDEASDPDARNELNVPCPGDTPDLALFGPEVEERMNEATAHAPLLPRFATTLRRSSTVVQSGSAVIDVSLDEGSITDGEFRIPVREIELELTQGDAADLYAFAEQLSATYNLRLGVLTKSQRGYLLAAQELVEVRRARAPKLDPDAPVDDLVAACISECLDHFVQNWPPLLQSDNPDAIHQMRVGIRRLRALLKVLLREMPDPRMRSFREEAGSIASALGVARDTDVFIAMAEGGPFAGHQNDAGISAFLRGARERREEGYGQAHAMLAAPQTTRFVLELRGYVARRGWRDNRDADMMIALGEPAKRFAARVLSRLDKRVRKGGRELEDASPEERHDVRIALKNLRYCAELFAPLFDHPARAKRFGRTLATLQDVLGLYNDAAVAAGITSDVERRAGTAAARPAGMVVGWTERGLAGASDHIGEHYRDFRRADRFWS